MSHKRFKPSYRNMPNLHAEEEKTFELYMHLPPEIRTMVIDSLNARDRCRFSRCSSVCLKDAKTSKKFVYALELSTFVSKTLREDGTGNRRFISIDVTYGEYISHLDRVHGYTVQFEEKGTSVEMIYMNLYNEQIMWSVEVRKKNIFVQWAVEYFRTLLNLHQNTLKVLIINECFIPMMNFDSEVQKMLKLEELSVECEIDYLNFFPKLGHRLTRFNYSVKTPIRHLTNYDQIYEIPLSLDIPSLRLNNEQFIQISASSFRIHIGNLEVEDIFSFIFSWQVGTMRSNFKEGEWCLSGSNFDIDRLFEYFENEEYGYNHKYVRSIISSFEDNGKRAELRWTQEYNLLKFDTVIRI